MTLNLIVLAGGLLALAAAAVAAFTRARSSSGITNEQLSGEWVAQARGKEEPW